MRLSPTRPQEVIDFEELLCELITMARMLRPLLGSRLVGALLTYVYAGVPCLVRSDAGVDFKPSEINLHVDHSPTLGARGWRCVPIIDAQRD